MKRIFKILAFAFSVLFFYSCAEETPEELKRPDVELISDGIAISIAVDNSASYVNIFRKELTTPPSPTPKISNIGMIIPSAKDLQDAYSFVDKLLVSGKKYSYCARYRHSGRYVYTGWSDWPMDESGTDLPPVTTTYSNDDALKFSVSPTTFFEYDESFQVLVLKGTAISPVSGFNSFFPAICISYPGKSRVFDILGLALGSGIPLDGKIDLRSILTLDFYDKDLTIEGVLYQRTDKTKPSYKKIFWSGISPIPVKDGDGNPLSTIKLLLSETNDNQHDFTPIDEENRAASVNHKIEPNDFSDF